MSIATVVTLGYGSFGSVNLVPTIGYSIGADTSDFIILATAIGATGLMTAVGATSMSTEVGARPMASVILGEPYL